MALTITTQDRLSGSFSYVSGVFSGQDTPAFLGQAEETFEIPLSTGSIVIGFDTRMSPATMRILYDKGNSIIPGNPDKLKFYGLVMTSEIQFQNLPILPGVLSEAVAYKSDYSDFVANSGFSLVNKVSSAFCMDMMSADRLVNSDPYFPYNSLNIDKAFTTANPNGFMSYDYSGSNRTAQGGDPLCASIISPVGIDLDGPSISEIKSILAHATPVMDPFSISDDDVTQGNAFDRVMSALRITDYGQIYYVQMYGNSILITMDDPEGYYPVLFADLSVPSSTKVYSLEINTINDLSFNRMSGIFERFIDFTIANKHQNEDYPSRQGHFTRSYSKSHDRLLATMMEGDGAYFLSAVYKIYCVGRGVTTLPNGADKAHYNCVGGVQLDVARIFDKDSLSFGPLQIQRPVELSLNDVVRYNQELYAMETLSGEMGTYRPELFNYMKAVNAKRPGSPDQDEWFSVYNYF